MFSVNLEASFDIEGFQQAIDEFDYPALRSIEVQNTYGKKRASEGCVLALINIFTRQYPQITLHQLKTDFGKIEKVLMSFKEKVQAVENTYANKEFAPLASDSSWVVRFSFMIEPYLSDMPNISKKEYDQAMKNISDFYMLLEKWAVSAGDELPSKAIHVKRCLF